MSQRYPQNANAPTFRTGRRMRSHPRRSAMQARITPRILQAKLVFANFLIAPGVARASLAGGYAVREVKRKHGGLRPVPTLRPAMGGGGAVPLPFQQPDLEER